MQYRISEAEIPVRPPVRGACGLFGIDPLNVANEGKAVIICTRQHATAVLAALHTHPLGRDARAIGIVTGDHPGKVIMETTAGGERLVDIPLGEDLPRIC